MAPQDRSAHARACFLRACQLDVEVRKPGNVSRASPGHRMHAELFIDSARATAGPLFSPRLPVGERIERAVAASWSAVGCNTNLGIVLLCAPVALAIEREDALTSAAALRRAIEGVLAGLDVADARAAYRAIVRAQPGGLGRAEAEDVHAPPQLGLREAMALAAARDSIAGQYANGYAQLFELGLPLLAGLPPQEAVDSAPDPETTRLVLRVFLAFLGQMPDSHIVRKHGEGVAQIVMSAAQAWRGHATPGQDPAFAAWDESLKAAGINPGTSADLTVAALLLAQLGRAPWHGS